MCPPSGADRTRARSSISYGVAFVDLRIDSYWFIRDTLPGGVSRGLLREFRDRRVESLFQNTGSISRSQASVRPARSPLGRSFLSKAAHSCSTKAHNFLGSVSLLACSAISIHGGFSLFDGMAGPHFWECGIKPIYSAVQPTV